MHTRARTGARTHAHTRTLKRARAHARTKRARAHCGGGRSGVLLRDVLLYSGLLTVENAELLGVRHVQVPLPVLTGTRGYSRVLEGL